VTIIGLPAICGIVGGERYPAIAREFNRSGDGHALPNAGQGLAAGVNPESSCNGAGQ
jgi:hypothetical protein